LTDGSTELCEIIPKIDIYFRWPYYVNGLLWRCRIDGRLLEDGAAGSVALESLAKTAQKDR
jgi:hypothetical protein